MIKANFNTYASYVTDSLYQWDINQVLSVSGLNLDVAPEIHFSNSNMDKAIVRQASLDNLIVSVNIPNSLLQEALTIKAHIGIYEGNTFKVVELIEIPVIAKTRPSDYKIENTDEEIYSFEALKNDIANMVTLKDYNANNSNVSASISKVNSDLTARIDNIIAHNNDTEGNTELVDIRVGADGLVYDSAGDATRYQIADHDELINALYDNSKNLYNEATKTYGFFVNQGDGKLMENITHTVSDYIKIKPNTTYIFTNKSEFYDAFRYVLYDANKQYISGEVGNNIITTPNNAKYIRFSEYGELSIECETQFKEGNEKTDYEYYNIQIDMDKVDAYDKSTMDEKLSNIGVKDTTFFYTSKNLLDMSSIIEGYFVHQNTGELTENIQYWTSEFVEVKKETDYIYSNRDNVIDGFRYALYDENYNFISGGFEITSIKTTSNTKYIRISSHTHCMTESQLEKGTVATSYEDYNLAYIYPEYIKTESELEEFIVNIPSKMYALVGEEFNIYFDNIVEGYDNDYDFNVTCSIGSQLERCYRLTPEDPGEYDIVINVTNIHGVKVEKTSTIIISDTSTGNGSSASVIILGDSTTNNSIAIEKLHTNFDDDVMTINTLGTRGDSPNNHEGRSGWTFKQYFNESTDTDVDNPFYNPSTKTFDAEYYFTNSGIDVPNWFVINLGINDVFGYVDDDKLDEAIETINTMCDSMIESLKTYNSNIKIGVCLTIPPNYSQDAFGKAYNCGQTRNRYKRNNVVWVNNLIEKYDNRESENIYVIPIHTNLDTKYNMGLEEITYNKRNSNTYQSPIGNGGVHPDESGYWQIADAYWYFLKAHI